MVWAAIDIEPSSPRLAPSAHRSDPGCLHELLHRVEHLILIPSMLGFVMKFIELINMTQGEADGGFAITPVVNYLFASLGFFFLLLWAGVNGMFNDLEKPKYDMLETEKVLDAM